MEAMREECAVEELNAVLASGLHGTLIDVREYPEYAAGRIPGARLIPLGELDSRAAEIDSGRPVFLVCRTGRRARLAQASLRQRGLGDVRNVTGGMVAWELMGGPIERDQTPPWSLERQVRLIAGTLVLLGVVLGAIVHPAFVLLSGFVGAGLAFAALTDTCAMAFLLARMPWNRGPRCRSIRSAS